MRTRALAWVRAGARAARAVGASRPRHARALSLPRRRAVVPVYDSLSARGQATFSWVLSATLAGVACVYLVVGMVPYLYLVGAAHVAVGDAVTLSLPGTWWAYGIMGAYCVALALTYPLMLFPVLRIAERAAARPLGLRGPRGRLHHRWRHPRQGSSQLGHPILCRGFGGLPRLPPRQRQGGAPQPGQSDAPRVSVCGLVIPESNAPFEDLFSRVSHAFSPLRQSLQCH